MSVISFNFLTSSAISSLMWISIRKSLTRFPYKSCLQKFAIFIFFDCSESTQRKNLLLHLLVNLQAYQIQDEWRFQHPNEQYGCHITTTTTRKCQNVMKLLQIASASIHVSISATYLIPQVPKESRASLLEKFEKNCTKLQDFVNQVWFVFCLQSHRYSTKET